MYDRCVGCPRRHRAVLTKARHGTINQAGMLAAERVIIETKARHDAGAKIFDDDISTENQTAHERLPVRVF